VIVLYCVLLRNALLSVTIREGEASQAALHPDLAALAQQPRRLLGVHAPHDDAVAFAFLAGRAVVIAQLGLSAQDAGELDDVLVLEWGVVAGAVFDKLAPHEREILEGITQRQTNS
jgi:hypothetical protein